MKIKLSDHFTYRRLLRFTLPSIVMMIFSSTYSVVDGYFISNYAGKTPFAAVSFIFPYLMILGAVGFMFGTGGSALVAKTLGEGNRDYANRLFSLFIYITAATGTVLAVLGNILMRPAARWLGASGEMLEDCVTYGCVINAVLPAFMLQMAFQSFMVTAEKPNLGLFFTVLSGVTNMVLDFVLVGVLRLGLVGAAIATDLGQVIGGVFPVIYFLRPNSSLLRLGKTRLYGRALLKGCTNGFSELLSNISMSVVGALYNFQLIRYAGENGVAAYGAMMYVGMIFMAIFIGYSVGVAPVVGFHYGAQNRGELKSLLRKSGAIILSASLVMLLCGEIFAEPLSALYVGYNDELLALTLSGFKIYAVSFLFSGGSVFGSSFFTALNDGVTSASISFLRTVVFPVASVMLLPLFFGVDGIWSSVIVSEALSLAVTLAFIVVKRKKYGYA